jgi:hypothetical protein
MKSTLQVRTLPGQTFVLAVLILIVLLGAGEAAVRLLPDDTGPVIAAGSENPTFDAKIGLLDRLAAKEGGVDCIILGSSVVRNAFIPTLIEQDYHAQTGQAITCYNFGLPALTARSAHLVADLLVERYTPRLLVYGFTLRALATDAAQAGDVYDGIAETPWVAYTRGTFSVEGWLAAHSELYRHYLAFRNWPDADYYHWRLTFTDAPCDGYQPFFATRPFDPATIEPPEYFVDFTLAAAEWAALEGIVALRSDRTRVLLVEMPLPAFVLAMFEGGTPAYFAHFDAIAALAEPHGVPLWVTSSRDLIPDDGWAEDGLHVNDHGAQVFSRWFAETLAPSSLLPR